MSQPIPLVLPTGSTIGRDGQDANARLINAYAEAIRKDGKAPYAIYATPGLPRWDSATVTGGARGLIELNSNALIAVLGNEIYSYDQSGAGTAVETLVGSDRVMMTKNRATTPQITILTSASQVFHLAGGVLTAMADSDLPAPVSVDYLGGMTIYGIADGRIFCSDLENATSVAADAFGIARAESSPLIRAFVNSGFIYAMKQKGIEIWQPDPSLAGQPFPFSPVQQNIDIGLGAKFSPVAFQRGLLWVDDEGLVRLGRDGAAARISSHSVERAIEDLSAADREAIYSFAYTHQGHEVVALTSSVWTWIYDALTGEWYERQSYGSTAWRANAHVFFNKKHIVGNATNGELYSIDSATATEAGEKQVMEIWCAQSHRFPDAMQVDALEVDLISGTGLNSADEHDANPLLMVDYSDDGGHSFEGERTAEIGRQGNYRQKVRLNRWGKVDEKGRIWRFRASANVLRGIIGAALWGEALNP